MRGPRSTVILSAVAFSMAGAQAADMSAVPLPSIEPPSQASEWYLRTDFGYRFNSAGSVTAVTTPNPTQNVLGDSFVGGIGAGIKMGWFRADLTIDYGSPDRYHGNSAVAPRDFSMDLETATALANIYADLGTWWGVTPYIGGGAGGSYLRAYNFMTASNAVPFSSPLVNQTNFTWAAMAGVSYGIGRMLVDVGYRRLDFGNVTSGADFTGNRLTLHRLTADEIRLGLRFAL